LSSGRIVKSNYIDIHENLEIGKYPTISEPSRIQTNLEEKFRSQINSFGINDTTENSINLGLSNELKKIYLKVFKVHLILLNSSDLTNNQKLEYCRIERYFMKLFLKEIVKKYE